jgi:hypothetical protein
MNNMEPDGEDTAYEEQLNLRARRAQRGYSDLPLKFIKSTLRTIDESKAAKVWREYDFGVRKVS